MGKNLGEIVLASAFVAASLLTNVKSAVADGNSASQIITFSVAPIRALYLDEWGDIAKILSNTPTFENKMPQVFQGEAEIPMNDKILEQYNLLLSRMDLSKPGVYEVSPSILQYSLPGTPYSALEKTFLDALGEKNSPDTYDKVIDTIKELEPYLDSATEDNKLVLTIVSDGNGSVDLSAEVIK